MIITIDGPVASGKSTIARSIAQRLGYYYIASGAVYRSLAYLLMRECGYRLETIGAVAQSDIINLLDAKRLLYCYASGTGETLVFDGEDITQYLSASDVANAASVMSANPIVRDAVVCFLRNLVKNVDSITDGRDCGSVLFPDAEIKFFLTASLDVRALRWQKLQAVLGNVVDFDEAKKLVSARDKRDSERAVAPLVIPDGALIIDSSALSQDQVIDLIIDVVKNKIS
ncbi:MAG: (d)CMP kinase [Candidatus Dependentiae bacterium]|nr:(d)CMP kinase [Candidatus Dependentiae bacterium]